MNNITLPGDACFTPSEARKLTDRINKLGVAANEIQGVWIHYVHLKPSDQRNDNVSELFCRKSKQKGWRYSYFTYCHVILFLLYPLNCLAYLPIAGRADVY
jgi:hypothetical protein